MAAVYAAGAVLAAAQILPGYEAASEGVRVGKVDYAFASMFSFPPENLLTLVAPGFFGDLTTHLYWGRCYLWEMSLFVGVAGLSLIAVAACDAHWRQQASWTLGFVALLGVFALGMHTPLFRLLYDYAPLFGSFRGISKFTFQAVLFFVLVLAMGADALVRGRLPPRGVAWGIAGLGGLAALVGVVAAVDPVLWSGLPGGILATGESYLPPPVFNDPAFRTQVAVRAGWTLVQGGGLMLLAGGVLWQSRRFATLRWVILWMLPLELIFFAQAHFATSKLDDAAPETLRKFLENHPGDYRIFDTTLHNNGFLLGRSELWGNDPSVLRRYAEFITATQGGDVEKANQYVNFQTLPEVYAMLRLRFAFVPIPGDTQVVEGSPPMARVQLLAACNVIPQRDAMLAALRQDFFDPRRTVYLETPPDPWPQPTQEPGHVRVIEDTPDALTVEADTSTPALLLNTDLYSKGWHVRPLPGSAQSKYQLLPADYVLRAVPLTAGHHRLRLEYRPATLGSGTGLFGLRVGGMVCVACMALASRCVKHDARAQWPSIRLTAAWTLTNP